MDRELFVVDEFVLLRALLLPGRTDEQVLTFLMSSPWHDVVLPDVVVERFDSMVNGGVLTVSDEAPWPPLLRRPGTGHVAAWRDRFATLLDAAVATPVSVEGHGITHPTLAPLDELAQGNDAVAIVTQYASAAGGTRTRLVTPAGFFDLLDE